jgi:hypothetical protein
MCNCNQRLYINEPFDCLKPECVLWEVVLLEKKGRIRTRHFGVCERKSAGIEVAGRTWRILYIQEVGFFGPTRFKPSRTYVPFSAEDSLWSATGVDFR